MSEYQSVADGVGDSSIATQAQEKVQQSAKQASRTAARYVGEQVEERGKQAAEELHTLAGALRRSSHSLHADGKSSTASGIETVVDRLEGVGRYLEQTGGEKMVHDLEAFGRRKPWSMIGLGLGVGVFASRFLKASSSRRFEESQQRELRAYGSAQPTMRTESEPWAPQSAHSAQPVGSGLQRGG
jgi:ElaB/YqjD/DUF883 family membrane-anchored ribosome-binding protein